MIVTVYTLFPDLVDAYRHEAILGRAVRAGALEWRTRDLRTFAGTPTGRVDDTPYGGGPGMVIRADVVAGALDEVRDVGPPPSETVLLSPSGERLDQRLIERFATLDHLVLIAGRYEGFDVRVESMVDREVSIGDFVLMGGELPALCIVEAVARLLPGVLGDAGSHASDSFTTRLLDHPHYTRPPSFRGEDVPDVLTSGHHARIERWRRDQALRRTLERRPDLLEHAPLDDADRAYLATLPGESARSTSDDEGR